MYSSPKLSCGTPKLEKSVHNNQRLTPVLRKKLLDQRQEADHMRCWVDVLFQYLRMK